jgi:hypothetical protein
MSGCIAVRDLFIVVSAGFAPADAGAEPASLHHER